MVVIDTVSACVIANYRMDVGDLKEKNQRIIGIAWSEGICFSTNPSERKIEFYNFEMDPCTHYSTRVRLDKKLVTDQLKDTLDENSKNESKSSALNKVQTLIAISDEDSEDKSDEEEEDIFTKLRHHSKDTPKKVIDT